MAQEKLTKSLMADIIHECRRNNVFLANDVLDVLDHMAYANAPVDIDVQHDTDTPEASDKKTSLDKPVVKDSTKQTYKRVCKQCGKEFEGTKKQQLCPDCKAANTKKSKQNWDKAHASVEKKAPADDHGVAQAVKDIIALGDDSGAMK